MEEEKKVEEQATSEPIQSEVVPAPAPAPSEAQPVENAPAPVQAEPIVINTEEPKVESLEPEKIESLNDEPIESLEPVESLDEPAGEVIIEGQESEETPAPAPSEVPVVPAATENPVLENPPKEEEKKPEPVKEEAKKEEKKPENAKDKKMLIVVIVGGVVLVGLIINMIVNGGLFGGNNEEEEEDEDEETVEPAPTNNKFDLSKAPDVMKPFELFDTCGNSFIVSLSKPETFTATINDLDKNVITNIILSQFESGTAEVTYDEFQSKAKSLFEFEGDFAPSSEVNKVSADAKTCEGFKYDEASKKFTKADSNTCTSTCSPLKKYEYLYKATEGTKQNGLVTITYKVLYGDITNEDNVSKEGLKVYKDSAKSTLVNTYPNKATDGTYNFGIISTGDYDKGTTIKFVFKEDGGKYTFVKSEVSK